MNSMDLLRYMAPVAVIDLAGSSNIDQGTRSIWRSGHPSTGGPQFHLDPALQFLHCLAYFVNLTNLLVTKQTSALTLQVILSSSPSGITMICSCNCKSLLIFFVLILVL